MIDPQIGRRFAHFRVTALRLAPELAHLPEHRDALSLGVEFHQRAQGRFHRFGIGVVAIVEELNPADLAQLQTRFRERRRGETRGAIFQRNAKGAAGGDGKDGVLHHVQARHGELRAAAMRPFQDGEFGAARGLGNIFRAHAALIDASENRLRARAARNAFAEGIVRVQDDRAVMSDGLRERAFFRGDRFAGTHEFDVREADVRDDGHVGRGDFREHRDLARVIHPQFPDRDFVLGVALQNRARQADVIVEIAFRFRDVKTSPECCRDKIFRARLAVAAGDGDDS